MAKKESNGVTPGANVINFENKSYEIDKLSPRAAESFNMLVRLQSDWNDSQYEMKKIETAQQKTVSDLKVIMVEDNIKPVKNSGIITQ